MRYMPANNIYLAMLKYWFYCSAYCSPMETSRLDWLVFGVNSSVDRFLEIQIEISFLMFFVRFI